MMKKFKNWYNNWYHNLTDEEEFSIAVAIVVGFPIWGSVVFFPVAMLIGWLVGKI